MAEETAAVETPPAEAPTVLKDFGNLDEVFDKVFPATAEKKEEMVPVPTPTTPGEPVPTPTTPVQPVKTEPAKVAATDELPDFLTGKVPEAKAPEPEPELPPPGPKESVGMKQLRTAYENLKKQNQTREAEYTAQIEEMKKAPAATPDAEARVKQLETQNQELSAAVERSAIEFHPGFRAEFVTKREQMVGDAHQILKDAGVEPGQWDRAMTLTGPARTEALEAIYDVLPRSAASELGAAALNVKSLDTRRDAVLADRKGLRERLQQEQIQQQRAALQQHEKNTLEMMGMAEKDLVDRMGIEVYKKSDNPEHAKWNESVEKMRADAKKLMLEIDDPSVMARAAYLAPAALQYRYLYHTMRDRWQEAEKKLSAIEKAEPSLTTKGAAPDTDDDKLTFAQAVVKNAGFLQ